jgi:hypothetical protein
MGFTFRTMNTLNQIKTFTKQYFKTIFTMKSIFFLILLLSQINGYSQVDSNKYQSPFPALDSIYSEIQLDKSLDTVNNCYWKNGDYKIFIQREKVLNYLEEYYSGIKTAMQTNLGGDTGLQRRNKMYAARYLKALIQVKEIDSSFNLRSLVVYTGYENAERNKGNSAEIEAYVRQLLENGQAVVYYKGQRVFKLKKRVVKDIVMSTINIYYDDDKNYAFFYFGYINW